MTTFNKFLFEKSGFFCVVRRNKFEKLLIICCVVVVERFGNLVRVEICLFNKVFIALNRFCLIIKVVNSVDNKTPLSSEYKHAIEQLRL